ncbi:MAG: metal-dependent hydrolase [Nanoarchaeota archaeon]
MLNKTHISVGIFFMILLLPNVVHVTSYILVFLIATVLPNIDSLLSGKKHFFLKPFRLFFKPRGFMHSFTFCFAVTFLLTWLWPVYSFPFFLGYGLHLLLDAWNIEGIKPFWPFKSVAHGKLAVGGSFETILFYSFIAADVILGYIVLF